MSKKSGQRAVEVPAEDEPAPKTVIRVRRGALRRFDQLKQKSADLPVDIKWDRRTDDRRASSGSVDDDRLRSERRQPPPFTWDVADFVVVGDRARETDAPAATTPAERAAPETKSET